MEFKQLITPGTAMFSVILTTIWLSSTVIYFAYRILKWLFISRYLEKEKEKEEEIEKKKEEEAEQMYGIKAVYMTQRFYDVCRREFFSAQQTDKEIPEVSGNWFIGIPLIVNNRVIDPPGFLAVKDNGTILIPRTKESRKSGD